VGWTVCRKCKLIAFCSAECAQLDRWHARECKALPRLAQVCRQDDMCREQHRGNGLSQLILAARSLRASADDEAEACVTRTSQTWAPTFPCLPSDLREMCYLEGSLSEPGLLEAAHLLFAVDCEQLLLPAPLHSQYAEDNGAAAEVVRCILQMQCNNFTAVDYYGKFVAEVCDPVTALMNHSCAPNAAVAWHCPARPGEHICHTVRCLEPLNPGDEVLISYVDTGQPWWSRQAALQSVHGFSCVCLVCHDIQRSVNGCRDNSRSASTATIRSSLQRIENASGQIMPYALRDVAGLRHFICEGLVASP